MIEAGEADQNVGGNVTQPPLITVILRLLHVQIISDLLLGEVMILPQIAETRIVVVQTVFLQKNNRSVLTSYHIKAIIFLYYNYSVIMREIKGEIV